MSWYGQFLEDQWIFENLKLPENGTFCDVGAYNGIESSNTYAFEQMGWKGICIEAVRENFYKCHENRSCFCVCVVASDDDRPVDFHINDDEPGLSGVNSPGRAELMRGARVDRIWDLNGYGHLNLLSIDTEGSELAVWSAARSLEPDIIVIEYLTAPNPPRDKEILAQLSSDGYREVHRTDANLILVKKDHL